MSGPEYLRYGGDTTCLEIRNGRGDCLVVDAGSGIRRLGNDLLARGVTDITVLFTHSHWDHILGFPFFKPLYRENTVITIHGCPLAQGNMEKLLSRTMSPPYFPVPFELVRGRVNYADVCVRELFGGLTVESIPLSHPNMGLGYKFTENGSSLVFLTDNELGYPHPGGKSFEEYADFCRGADLVIHDAEYTAQDYKATRGWGHSLFTETVRLALVAGVPRLGLFHHNQDRSDDGIDAMVATAKRLAAQSGREEMEIFAVAQGMELTF